MKKNLVLALLLIFIIVPSLKGIKQTHNPKNYILVVDVLDYDSTFKNSLKYFFKKVLKKGDSFFLVTPKKLYNLSKYSVNGLSNKIIDGTIRVLKRDIESGGILWRETTNKRTIRDIKNTYEQKILNCSKIFKNIEGDNNLVMIYQVRYSIDNTDSVSSSYKSMALKVGDQYKMKFDSDKVTAALNEKKIKFHFLYLNFKDKINRNSGDASTRRSAGSTSTSNSMDQIKGGNDNSSTTYNNTKSSVGIKTNNSSDVYKVYLNIAKKSNGVNLTSKKPISFFKKLKKL